MKVELTPRTARSSVEELRSAKVEQFVKFAFAHE